MLRDTLTRKTLFIIRGAPGSGKTVLAHALSPAASYAADDWFYLRAGKYQTTYEEVFDPELLPEAHAWCLDRTKLAMDALLPKVAVHNTFAKTEHMTPYLEAAEQRGYVPSVIVMQNDYGNVHGVPEQRVIAMRHEIENNPFTYRRVR
jgi:predicted ABC-type ATPase